MIQKITTSEIIKIPEMVELVKKECEYRKITMEKIGIFQYRFEGTEFQIYFLLYEYLDVLKEEYGLKEL